MQASPMSRSPRSRKVWPQKRGKVGKLSPASVWLASMSVKPWSLLVAAGAHGFIGQRIPVLTEVILVFAGSGEAGDDRHLQALKRPDVCPQPVVVLDPGAAGSTLEASLQPDQAWRPVMEALR